jgi:ketosteroid isomerase-like protein
MGLALETLQKWFSTVDADLLAEDIVWTVSLGYPVSQCHYSSRQEVFEKFFPELKAHFCQWSAKPEMFIEADDKVIVKGRYVGQVKHSNAPIEVEFIHIWTVHNDVITEVVSVADTAQFAHLLN